MDAEMSWNFFNTALHESAIKSIPKKLIKNTHIPGLGLEIIVAQSGKNAEKYRIRGDHQPDYFFFF